MWNPLGSDFGCLAGAAFLAGTFVLATATAEIASWNIDNIVIAKRMSKEILVWGVHGEKLLFLMRKVLVFLFM